MKSVNKLKSKIYYQLMGEDLLDVADEMEIDTDKITDEDLKFVADKMSEGIEWWSACYTAWRMWEDK